MIKKLLFTLLFSLFVFSETKAQYPFFYTYNDENGLPSNEVYSIAQDKNGFIWIGTDAGLYKFDGVKYIPYKSADQKSKSITGITFSDSGTLYCYNFQSQLFYLKNNALTELKHNYTKIPNIAKTQNGIIVNHEKGIALFDEKKKTWTTINSSNKNELGFTNSVKYKDGKNYFLYPNGIGIFENKQLKTIPFGVFKTIPSGAFLLSIFGNSNYLFSVNRNLVYTFENNEISPVSDKKLLDAIRNRKITTIKQLQDGNLWICTFNGIIQYNPNKNILNVFYPELSFSDCFIDREGNYWFSTLQSGIIRIPNLDYLVWNDYKNSKLTKITTDKQNIYFSTINGNIGKLNIQTKEINIFPTKTNADIQSLFYDVEYKNLYFFTNNHINEFDVKTNQITTILEELPPVKYILKLKENYLFCSSFGAFIYDIKNKKRLGEISDKWSREAVVNQENNEIWLATNEGLQRFLLENNQWKLKTTFLENKQILSLDFNQKTKQLLVLTFNGKVYSVSDKKLHLLFSLSEEIQTYKIKSDNEKIYVASNKGLWNYNFQSKNINSLNYLSGISSENIQDFILLNNDLWLATGKGLQKIPLTQNQSEDIPKAVIRLKNNDNININFGEEIQLFPEVSSYSSNGKFQYAYRINKNPDWVILPSSIENISIQNLPSGNFEIELKAIDHLKRNSENTIIIKGNVNAPFWQKWWFIVACSLVIVGFISLVLRFQWEKRQKKLQMQNQFNSVRLTAIKSQMNPHFIFNSLNSIQDLILKGDVEQSYNYLNTFSDLVRKTLNYSDKEFIDFEDEISLIETYLSLEKLRFKKDFEYSVTFDETDGIMLPPMLVQPFIENSLVHGLLHKDGMKKLNIHFRADENLICTITDNGIGRENAKAIRKRQGVEHKSFSGKAIEKRFEILSEMLHGKFGYKYEDLEQGTKVVLVIPVRRRF